MESASFSSDGHAFWCRTSIPSSAGVTHDRMLGEPSTFTKQLGHFPEQHNNPRGRWYLKLRLKMRCPALKNGISILSERTEIQVVDERMEMPGFGADIPIWGTKFHRPGALKPDSDRALLQDCH